MGWQQMNISITEIANRGSANNDRRGVWGQNTERDLMEKLNEEIDELETAIYCNEYKSFSHMPDDDDQFVQAFENQIKDTVGGELANIIIVACSGAKKHGIEGELLSMFISACLRYDSLRE